MAKWLSTKDPDFAEAFASLLSEKREVSGEVDAAVREIIMEVQNRGDEAVIALSKKFDNVDLGALGARVSEADIDDAFNSSSQEAIEALTFARDRIKDHHQRQLPVSSRYQDPLGVELGDRWSAVESVGLYVPGGTASYPSSVLMNAVPATVAGVGRIAMMVPTPSGELNPLVLTAARLAGVSEIYRIGGAQAIAVFAHGTETIAPVVKIVGPGNAYVAAAKRQVFGIVGIDSIAGPSEVLVIADRKNRADWIAADLIAQAEHDPAAQSILMTDDRDFARDVEAQVAEQLAKLPRGNIAAESWNVFGAIIVLSSLDEAPELADRIAAEHLEIATENCEDIAGKIRNAGAIFLGAYTPEVIGDYVAGSNHVLPTARSARFSSGLGVLDFMKRTSILKLGPQSLSCLAPAAMTLARAEGLEGHRRSVEVRIKSKD